MAKVPKNADMTALLLAIGEAVFESCMVDAEVKIQLDKEESSQKAHFSKRAKKNQKLDLTWLEEDGVPVEFENNELSDEKLAEKRRHAERRRLARKAKKALRSKQEPWLSARYGRKPENSEYSYRLKMGDKHRDTLFENWSRDTAKGTERRYGIAPEVREGMEEWSNSKEMLTTAEATIESTEIFEPVHYRDYKEFALANPDAFISDMLFAEAIGIIG